MEDKIRATLSVAALYNLLNKDVKVTFLDDGTIVGRLTNISSYGISVFDGKLMHGAIPKTIELDNEDQYTWELSGVKEIEPYAPEE